MDQNNNSFLDLSQSLNFISYQKFTPTSTQESEYNEKDEHLEYESVSDEINDNQVEKKLVW